MNECNLDFSKYKIKKTKNRMDIYNVLDHSDIPLNANEIDLILKKDNIFIDLSTIYRVLKVFEEKGIVRKALEDTDKSVMYELTKNIHKHYLLCNSCNGLEEVNMCPLDNMREKIEKERGFLVDYHNLTIRGTCKNCLKKEAFNN